MAFIFVSGRPSLDLIGTLKWRRRERTEEQLTEPALLSDWAQGADLVDEPMSVTAADLSRAIELREALYRIVHAQLTGRDLGLVDVNVLNAHGRHRSVAPQLLANGHVRRRASTRQLLASVALDTLDLLAGPEITRVRECTSADCTRLYVDSSRGRNRRWCGMAECGNRAKAEVFRQRHKPQAVEKTTR